MKISVLIIAHNEEKYIARCIESILNQTMKPNQIVVIVHNSTDTTEYIAKKYPIDVYAYDGPAGVSYSRIEGLTKVKGEIVICIDGDSYAKENWVFEMYKNLNTGNILVGSWVKFKGTLFGKISSIFNKFLCKTKGKKSTAWIWGPSFGFWLKDIDMVKKAYMQGLELTKVLHLSLNPEDYWLALFMNQKGSLKVTNKTHVCTYSKELTNWQFIRRHYENRKNGSRIRSFLRDKNLELNSLKGIKNND